MSPIERRNLDRYKIPEAKVLYYAAEESNIVTLTDISKSSIRFEPLAPLKVGDPIEVELIIPAKEKILLKGTIIGRAKDDSGTSEPVVVQFAPFGSDERYNSSHSYKQLSDLINEFQDMLENT